MPDFYLEAADAECARCGGLGRFETPCARMIEPFGSRWNTHEEYETHACGCTGEQQIWMHRSDSLSDTREQAEALHRHAPLVVAGKRLRVIDLAADDRETR